ncbi:MAG: YceI family protein [Bacteroidia bacterium]
MKIKFQILMAGALFFMVSCGSGNTTETANNETSAEAENHEGHDHEGHDHNVDVEETIENYTINADSSSIKWTVDKVFSDGHFGSINLKEGMLEMTNEELSGGSFTVDMTNIMVEDIEEGSKRDKLEAHLTGTQEKGAEDFFNSTVYPTSSLSITTVEKTEGGYNVTADLTIKDKTLPVIFPATITETEEGITANGTIEVNRIDYGITYHSQGLAQKVADEYLIKDIFTLEVELVASK